MHRLIKLERVYHPIDKWEEIGCNMWGVTKNAPKMLQDAIKFTGNAELYGSFMLKVIDLWPFSCENALTDNLLNQKAWIGHAACAMALSCPESITRKAWKELTDEQRYLANEQARAAIQKWKLSYIKSKNIRGDLAQKVLFE